MKDDIIKLLDLEDSDLVVEGPVVSKSKKILTLFRQLKPVYCPVCDSRAHSKGIYTITVNHPVLQSGDQLDPYIIRKRVIVIKRVLSLTRPLFILFLHLVRLLYRAVFESPLFDEFRGRRSKNRPYLLFAPPNPLKLTPF